MNGEQREPSKTNGFQSVLKNDSLAVFIESMGDFDKQFCDLMMSGNDFTLRMEVHGNCNKLLHARVYRDHIRRPTEK